MPKYQMYFYTQDGWKDYRVDIDEDEPLTAVLPDILNDLQEMGYTLEGWRGGLGDVAVTWAQGQLDLTRYLPQQGVKPNEVLRVAIKLDEPSIQIRRRREMLDVVEREELLEGDDIIIGRTMLRFHTRKYQQSVGQSTTFIERLQQGRSLKQTVYYMSIVGGIAGLACWFTLSLIVLAWSEANADWVNYSLLGAFVGALTVGFSDYWLGDRTVPRFVLVGGVAGLLAGLVAGMIAWPISSNLGQESSWVARALARALGWMIAGALIGLAISFRWYSVNKTRVLHGLMGGLFGGLLGGITYWSLSQIQFIGGSAAQALGLVLTGLGIACAISLAPILTREGILEFAASGDPHVLQKFGAERKQWELHDGGKYVIGSLGLSHSQTFFSPEVQIYVPDQLVAERHAILLSKKGKYYLEPHPSLQFGPRFQDSYN